MTTSEKAAVRQLQDENLRLRVELEHERARISTAYPLLASIPATMVRLNTALPDEIARLIDGAIAALAEQDGD